MCIAHYDCTLLFSLSGLSASCLYLLCVYCFVYIVGIVSFSVVVDAFVRHTCVFCGRRPPTLTCFTDRLLLFDLTGARTIELTPDYVFQGTWNDNSHLLTHCRLLLLFLHHNYLIFLHLPIHTVCSTCDGYSVYGSMPPHAMYWRLVGAGLCTLCVLSIDCMGCKCGD